VNWVLTKRSDGRYIGATLLETCTVKHIAKTITFLGKVAGQKTAGTECGKRVKVADLAIDVDSDCPACRAAAEKTHASHIALIEYAKTLGVTYSQKDWDDAHGRSHGHPGTHPDAGQGV
jgi:hypothetical protein